MKKLESLSSRDKLQIERPVDIFYLSEHFDIEPYTLLAQMPRWKTYSVRVCDGLLYSVAPDLFHIFLILLSSTSLGDEIRKPLRFQSYLRFLLLHRRFRVWIIQGSLGTKR